MKNTSKQTPLVTIVVITYNSSKYVLETLESCVNQSYENIELIISDDASKDETVVICREWLSKHKNRFVRTELITTKINSGIPANCNRGVKASHGDWIKIIAGDDLLLNRCIEDNIDFISAYPNNKIIISDMEVFYSDKPKQRSIRKNQNVVLREPISPKLQAKWLRFEYFGFSPSLFIHQKIYQKIKYDEEFKLIEDYPFAFNVVNNGFHFSYLNKVTVKYRLHEKSVIRIRNKSEIFNKLYLTRRAIELKYIYPEINTFEKIIRNIEFYRLIFIDRSGMNRNIYVCKVFNYLTARLSPYYWYEIVQLNLIISKKRKIQPL